MFEALRIAFPLVSGIVLGIGVLWMQAPFFVLARRSVGLLDTLISDLDEDDKFAAVNAATNKTILSLLKTLALLAVVLGVTAWTYWYLPGMFLLDTLGEGWKFGVFTIGTVLPFLYPRKSKSAYGAMAQLFHHLILDHYHLGKALLKRQIKGVENPVNENGTSAVLVTGLARAGTTALTRTLTERGPFTSLDYSNMPVLMAPRLWAKFYKPSKKETQERAHGDGIKVGLASVEALEEYFFKAITSDRYITEQGLIAHELSAEENDLYRRYFKSLCGPDHVYLAKNNNALLRLPSLLKQNPDMKVFVMIREPLQHAYSLMKQHQKFTKEQQEDPFILDYMNWLGHHEFGLGQKPFVFDGHSLEEQDRNSLNYWLERWVQYYTELQKIEGVEVIAYESFLAAPDQVVERIATSTGIAVNADGIARFEKKLDTTLPEHSTELAHKAAAIYAALTRS